MTDLCTIGVILNNSFGRFYWVIPKLTSLTENVGDFYWSPEMRHLDNIWKLRMYPQGTDSIPGYIMLQLWRKNVDSVKPVRFSFDIYKNDFSEEEIVRSQRFDSDTCFSSGVLRFMRRSILLRSWSKLAFMDNLNIVFTIWIDEPTSMKGKQLVSVDTQTEEVHATAAREDAREQPDLKGKALISCGTQTEEVSGACIGEETREHLDFEGKELTSCEIQAEEVSGSCIGEEAREHLDIEDRKHLHREKQTEDVPSGREDTHDHLEMKGLAFPGLDMKDFRLDERCYGVTVTVKDRTFKAHREILEARAPVLANFCSEKMAENSHEIVRVMDCEPDAFAIFLLFVYSRTVENLTCENFTDVFFIADKYSLPELKAECVRYMLANLALGSVCNVIALASRHGEEELLKRATEFFMVNAQDILPTVEWRRFMAENPDQANELYIRTLTFYASNK